jgi:hypothetical protein
MNPQPKVKEEPRPRSPKVDKKVWRKSKQLRKQFRACKRLMAVALLARTVVWLGWIWLAHR